MVLPANPEPAVPDLVDALRQHSQTLAIGAKLPTVRELMKQHGVSQAIVQRAVAELEREGLLSAEVGRGTFVRRPAATSEHSARSVVILNHERPGLRGEMIAARLHEQLVAAGNRSVLMTYSDLAHAGEWLRAMPAVDACVLRPQSDPIPASILAAIKSRCRAVVVEGTPVEHLDIDSVATDWLLAIETAVRHLRSRGREQLALVLNDRDSRYAREGARLFKSMMRLLNADAAPVVYLNEPGSIDLLNNTTAVIAWSADAVRTLRKANIAQPVVALESPDLHDDALAGLTIIGRTSQRVAAAVIERIDFRLANPDAAYAPVFDKPKLVIG